ncbi:putative glutamate 5-kinase [Magnetofaba australis IT-1]|uniref:Glutamate 5-kinase n=2 Tax=Magnetofaba TaxID=1472292 RepID=A0A1Y2K1W7_9PROT|nr:putative glutamate 5-kinase [Magnetofaba australis IT-1]
MEQMAEAGWRRVRESKRIVVKIGSNLLAAGEDLRRDWIAERCATLARLMDEGRQIVVVTSGSVAAGTKRLGLGRRPANLREKQAAAAAGQGVLMRVYEEAFAAHGRHVAQILLTRDDVAHRRRYLNARDTLETLLELGLVPVVNENDSVVTAEIRFGDNDTLGALVAGLIEADLLILLSDVDALYDANPRQNPDARPIPVVERVTPEIEKLADGGGSLVGSGGMETKLRAAKMAARVGCQTVLTNGFRPLPIDAVIHNGPVGTLFLAPGDPISSRKRWIAHGLKSEGTLHLDAGAARALLSGKSLLAKGVTAVDGAFDRGAAVFCCDPEGRRLAKGMVNYAAEHLRLIAGHHTSEFESILGFIGDEEVLHRDDMVQLRSGGDGHE